MARLSHEKPNEFTDPASLTKLENGTWIVNGYQSYRITPGTLQPGKEIARKLTEAVKMNLQGKEVLDLGAAGGYVSCWALRRGAELVRAIELDPPYVDILQEIASYWFPGKLLVSRILVQDIFAPADVVFALALIHWLYTCTAQYGSLDAIASHLAHLAKETLVVEWIDPADPWIIDKKHLDYRKDLQREPYTKEAFKEAFGSRFKRFYHAATVRPTREIWHGVHS